jgi:hypothetical protein
MSISTLQPSQKRAGRSFRKFKLSNILIYSSAVLAAVLLVFFGRNIVDALKKIGSKSALTADVAHGRAEVFLNDELLGATPFESDEIKPGENKITLKSGDRQYETTIKFLSNSDKYIHKVGILRDLGISELFSSGQDLWFDESTSGTVLRIISEPAGASVYIDGTEVGKTPYTSSKLSEGDYDWRVEHVGYEPQKNRIRIQKGYTSNISVKLFPMPVPSRVSVFEQSDNLFEVASDNSRIIADPTNWAKAVVYWNQTRGVNLEGSGLNKDLVFDYYIDYQGNLYNSRGDPLLDLENTEELANASRGAYLGRVSDGPGLTEPAKETLQNFKNIRIIETSTQALILPTGTGWLRVRNDPSLNGTEVARVDVGNKYPLLEEDGDWVKIVVSEDLEGWVSKRYVEITENEEETENMEMIEEETTEPEGQTQTN